MDLLIDIFLIEIDLLERLGVGVRFPRDLRHGPNATPIS